MGPHNFIGRLLKFPSTSLQLLHVHTKRPIKKKKQSCLLHAATCPVCNLVETCLLDNRLVHDRIRYGSCIFNQSRCKNCSSLGILKNHIAIVDSLVIYPFKLCIQIFHGLASIGTAFHIFYQFYLFSHFPSKSILQMVFIGLPPPGLAF